MERMRNVEITVIMGLRERVLKCFRCRMFITHASTDDPDICKDRDTCGRRSNAVVLPKILLVRYLLFARFSITKCGHLGIFRTHTSVRRLRCARC